MHADRCPVARCQELVSFLKLSLIQHTFTAAAAAACPFPDGSRRVARRPKTRSVGRCVWRSPLLYAQQLDLMLLLQRIIEHFAASVFTVDHTRSADAVRMVVPACIAAVADVRDAAGASTSRRRSASTCAASTTRSRPPPGFAPRRGCARAAGGHRAVHTPSSTWRARWRSTTSTRRPDEQVSLRGTRERAAREGRPPLDAARVRATSPSPPTSTTRRATSPTRARC